MAIYNLDAVNEQLNENSILDSLEEACDYMMSMLGESTAAQRHYHLTSKDVAKFAKSSGDEKEIDKYYADKKNAEKAAKDLARHFHGGAHQKNLNDIEDATGEYKDELKDYTRNLKTIADAGARGSAGHSMSRAARTGVDVKGAYNKEKKRVIKETCLHILSIIDDIEE